VQLLYELDEHVGAATASLLEHYGQGSRARQRLTEDVDVLLADEAVTALVRTRIDRVYASLRATTLDDVRGPLGLYLCLSAAATAAKRESGSGDAARDARDTFRDRTVRQSLRDYYRIPESYDLREADLWRIGTTSLIVRCRKESGSLSALKCLLPRYLSVKAIRDRTNSYDEDYAILSDSVPSIHMSTERLIAMDFIEGDTVAERFARRSVIQDALTDEEYAKQRALGRGDIDFIRQLGLALSRALETLALEDRAHLDLSPSNIIVVSDPDAKHISVKLIDLGVNYAITERVGSSSAFRLASSYVAPELLRGESTGDSRCDLYSLGVILLEASAKRPFDSGDLVTELDRLWAGDVAWDGAPGLARIVEDLIDAKPENRLLLYDGEPGERYGYLRKLITQETDVLKLYETHTESQGFGLLRGLALVRFWSNEQLKNLLEAPRRVDDPVNDEYRDFPVLARWAAISIALWTFTLAAFLVLTLADLHFELVYPWVHQLSEAGAFEVGDFWGNLPGRLVALTFALTAVTYYVNNFSILSPKRLGGRLAIASDAAMRATAVLLYGPILWTMLYNPDAWPLCSGIGTLLVVLNNYLALQLATRGEAVGSQFSTRSMAGRRFIEGNFSEWWVLMGAYSVSMIAIGALLLADRAHDAWLFAILVVAINVLKMYRLNCIFFAPQVRGWLGRDILTMRRARNLRRAQAAGPDRGQGDQVSPTGLG
jgi:serine/threonine protein kinase